MDSSSLSFALRTAVFAAACFGHLVFMVVVHNVIYGHFLYKPLSRALRDVIGLITLGGPVLFLYLYGLDAWGVVQAALAGSGPVLVAAYLGLCWIMGFVVFPAVTLKRCLRRPPAALVQSESQLVNVARELGTFPAGRGRHRLMARLPRNEIFQVEFIERTLAVPGLPPQWDGLTILQLTDLHFLGTPDRDFFRFVAERCAAWEPDLVAVTGDIVDSKRHHRWIVPVLGRLRWKVAGLAILGNHDLWYEPALVRKRLRRCGLRVLGNGWEMLNVRGVPLVVIGHEGPWFLPAPDLTGCPPDVFRLCLSHTPDNIAWARRHGVNLMLSGHNHGGQIRLPLVGSVFVPSRYGRRYDCGLFHEPPTLLYVSRGIGGDHPVRFNCRPEVTRFVLRCLG